MKLNGFIKRAFFFFAAFAVGISITGLLFGFQAPRFGHKHREGKRQYVRELKVENERLRAELEQSKRGLPVYGLNPPNDEEILPAECYIEIGPAQKARPSAPARHNHK